MTSDNDRISSLARGVRLDLVIAICALLVSSLATAASWWQTRVIQQQLSAQVWPYFSVTENLDQYRFSINFENDGLGPAILRSISVDVDGKPTDGLVAMMHTILGRHIAKRVPHGEHLGLDLSTLSPGSVLRAGQTTTMFALDSKTFAPGMLAAYRRIGVHACYCAIVPGTCWLVDSLSAQDPKPLAACTEVPHDLLHNQTDTTLSRNI